MATASATHTASDDNDFRYYKSYLDECRLTQNVSQDGVVEGLNKYIADNIENWKTRGLKVVVTGNSGTGKSSLINALLNLKADSMGAAKVGVIETTTTPKKYEFPENPNVALWDLPGCGTEIAQNYVKNMKLSEYDVFIVVSATRFSENELMLANAIEKMGKNILFVRTKIDIDLMNAKRDYPATFKENVCMDAIKGDIKTHLANKDCLSSNRGIYLVSCPDRSKYDLPNLLQALKVLLNKKSKAIPKLIQIEMEKIMKEKCNNLDKAFKPSKIISSVAGFIPIPGVETIMQRGLLWNIRKTCQKQFSLDDESLTEASNGIGLSVQTLEDKLDKLISTAKLHTTVENKLWSHFSKYFKYYVPIFGSVTSAQNSNYTMYYCVHTMCNYMAANAMKLTELRLNKLEEEMRLFPAQT